MIFSSYNKSSKMEKFKSGDLVKSKTSFVFYPTLENEIGLILCRVDKKSNNIIEKAMLKEVYHVMFGKSILPISSKHLIKIG